MSKQDFERLNMNVTPINFDSDELEDIQTILSPLTPTSLQNVVDDKSLNTTSPADLSHLSTKTSSNSFSAISIDFDDIPTQPSQQIQQTPTPTITEVSTELEIAVTVASEMMTPPSIQQVDEAVEIVKDTAVKTDGISPVAEIANSVQKTTPASPISHAQQTTYSVHQPLDTPLTFAQRLCDALFIGVIFSLLGLLVDWALHISRALSSSVVNEMTWLFLPCFTFIGVIFGFFFGAKALDIIFGSSATNGRNADDGFTSGLLKAVGIGLGIAVLAWLVMLILL